MPDQELSDNVVSQVEAEQPDTGDKAQQEGVDVDSFSGRLNSSHFTEVLQQLIVQGPLDQEDLPAFVLEMMPVVLPLGLTEVNPEEVSWPKMAQLAMSLGFASGFMCGVVSSDPTLALRPLEVTTLGLVTGSAAYHHLEQNEKAGQTEDENVHRENVPAETG